MSVELHEQLLPPGQKTFTAKEVAAITGYSPMTLRIWRCTKDPKGPAYLKNGKGRNAPVTYPRAYLADWLKRITVVPPSE